MYDWMDQELALAKRFTPHRSSQEPPKPLSIPIKPFGAHDGYDLFKTRTQTNTYGYLLVTINDARGDETTRDCHLRNREYRKKQGGLRHMKCRAYQHYGRKRHTEGAPKEALTLG